MTAGDHERGMFEGKVMACLEELRSTAAVTREELADMRLCFDKKLTAIDEKFEHRIAKVELNAAESKGYQRGAKAMAAAIWTLSGGLVTGGILWLFKSKTGQP